MRKMYLSEKMENYLEARKNTKIFIKRGEVVKFISIQDILMNLIPKYGIQEVLACIETNKNTSTLNLDLFLIEIDCCKCESLKVIGMSKTNLILLFRNKFDFVCKECKAKIKAKEKKIEEDKEPTISLEESTQNYIDVYLNPDYRWNKNVTVYNKIQNISTRFIDDSVVERYIKSMDYKAFLKTPYWKAITAKKMKDANFRCQLCNSKGILSTHHRDYSIHGREVYNLKELIVLCQDCHGKHHNH